MEENDLIEIAKSIDDVLMEKLLKYNLSVNGLNGVILARLIMLNQEAGNMANLRDFMNDILANDFGVPPDEQEPKIH
jgi:hypothetical protein